MSKKADQSLKAFFIILGTLGILFGIIIFYVWSISVKPKKNEEGDTRLEEAIFFDLEETAFEGSLTSQDIELIKTKSLIRKKELSIPDHNEQLQPVPLDFLERNLFQHSVSIGYLNQFPQDHPMFYHFGVFKELEMLYFFSIIYTDESCCRLAYGILAQKDSNIITDIAQLGLIGGDGGWVEDDSGVWTTDSTLEVLKYPLLMKRPLTTNQQHLKGRLIVYG